MSRSGRCYACKARKVKCDETVPQCQRCIKAGRACPGYRNEKELAFRDMTCFAEKQVESRVQNILRARNPAEKSVPRVFAGTYWREKAITRFFSDYVLESDSVPHTTIILPILCSSLGAGICLRDALYAVAFVSQANQLGLPWMAIEANKIYGHALASLAKALKDPVESLKDTTLATPYLLGWYEGISGYLPTGILMDLHHHRGRKSLLLLRASRQFSSPIGRCLFGISHELVINKCLIRHEKPLVEATAWIRIFGTKGPSEKIEELNVHTAQICAEAQILFDSNEHGVDWEVVLLKNIQEANAIGILYQDWIDEYSISEIWGYQTFYLPPDQTFPGDGMVQVHHDLWTAYVWTSCRSKCAHLYEVSLHCLSLLGCHPRAKDLSSKLRSLGLYENLLTRSEAIIDDMVSGICATVPFMLGDIDSAGKSPLRMKRTPLMGYKLLWPLNVARASSEKGSAREAWIKGRLEFIDTKMGIRFGGRFANKVMKQPWNLN